MSRQESRCQKTPHHTSLDSLLGLLFFSGVTAGNFLSSISLSGEERRVLFTPSDGGSTNSTVDAKLTECVEEPDECRLLSPPLFGLFEI